MEIELRPMILADATSDALILPVGLGLALDPAGATIDERLAGGFTRALNDAGFSGLPGRVLTLTTLDRIPAKWIIAVGTGTDGSRVIDDIRRAWASGARAARTAGARTIASAPPPVDVGIEFAFRAATEGVELGLYRYLEQQTSDIEAIRSIDCFTFAGSGADARRGVEHGRQVASGVLLARDLVNRPANLLGPEDLASIADTLAREHSLELEAFDKAELQAMGAGAILAVGGGSLREPRLIRLTYRPAGESLGTIGLVGKGITFDTGGINLKPTGPGLERMKADMAGAAAVLGVMQAISSLAPPYTVHGVIAAAENMVSGSAFRPGDVVTSLSGKTIEVASTDAEGRMVLADALTYTARLGADLLIDIATLTGASIVALGSSCGALFATHEELADDLLLAAGESGEKLWQLPLFSEYRDLIRGDVADLKNSAGRAGAAINAALFLHEFTDGLPWAHIDCSGPVWADRGGAYISKGGTGFGVRTLLSYLEHAEHAEHTGHHGDYGLDRGAS